MSLDGIVPAGDALSVRTAFHGLGRLVRPLVEYDPASLWESDTRTLPRALQRYRRRLRAFARSIDGSIARHNDDYKSHRSGDRQLRPPVVRLVKSGTFYEWMKARGRLGGQNKVPRIVDRELAEGLLP